MNKMKKTLSLITLLLFFGVFVSAKPQLANLSEVKPDKGSPAAVGLAYLKAGSAGDVETMKELTFGIPKKNLKTEETKISILKKLADIDWEKEVQWVELIEDSTGKASFRYFLKGSGRKSGYRMKFKLIDGGWKYGF